VSLISQYRQGARRHWQRFLPGNAQLKLLIFVIYSMLLGACSTAPSQLSLKESKDVFKSGEIRNSIKSFEEAYKNQKDKDTTYYLEKGNLLRYLGTQYLSESSLELRVADNAVQNWEAKARTNVARSTADFLTYFMPPVAPGSPYEPKDFEKSMLSFNLAVNHVLAGRWDLAMIEARKMGEREKLIEALQEKRIEAISVQESENASKKNAAFSSINIINGYPVNVINSPEVNALKNSFQSAASHYLAAFIFEQQKEAGLAAPGYRLAAELRPQVPIFGDSLYRLDDRVVNHAKDVADTLIIVETGHIPRIYSHKSSHNFPTSRGPRRVTFTIPAIDIGAEAFNPSQLDVAGIKVPLFLASDLNLLARRQLRDAMPEYILKASMRAVVQVVAQEAAQAAIERNKKKDDGAGKFAAALVGLALSVGDADVRSWTTLPSAIYIGRLNLPKGEASITIPTPLGSVATRVRLIRDYEIIHVRIFSNQAIVTTVADYESIPNYMQR